MTIVVKCNDGKYRKFKTLERYLQWNRAYTKRLFREAEINNVMAVHM